jgi:hypothetical protein
LDAIELYNPEVDDANQNSNEGVKENVFLIEFKMSAFLDYTRQTGY